MGEHPAFVMKPAMVAVVAVTKVLTVVETTGIVLIPDPVTATLKELIPPPLIKILPL